MTVRRRTVLALSVGLAVARHLATPAVAYAHVNFLESDPPGGALEGMPPRLVLRFSGPIEPRPRAQLLTVDGSPVPGVGAALDQGDFRQMVVTLPPLEGSGVYTLIWTVVSLEDGHEQRGFFGLLSGTPSLAVVGLTLDSTVVAPGDLDVQLAAVPDEQGLVQWVTNMGGPTAPAVTRVQYSFRAPLPDVSSLLITGEWNDALGGYASAQAIALAGEWRAEVVVRRQGIANDLRLPFVWTATPPPAPAA